MNSGEAILTTDASKGTIILPHMLSDPLTAPHMVGVMLKHDVRRGDRLTDGDLQLDRQPDAIPFFEYLDRPGAIDRIVDLDRRTFDEMGFDFSDGPWHEENFRRVLPGKAEVSFVSEMQGEFVGYCIGSESAPGEIHGHRIVIEPKWRTGRLALQIWCAHWRRTAENPSHLWLTGEVSTTNRRMLRFLETLGFHRLDAAETRDYLDIRGRDDALEGCEIVGAGGARSLVMALRVRGSD